jgi:ABC-type arginine transport system ATPase subunit
MGVGIGPVRPTGRRRWGVDALEGLIERSRVVRRLAEPEGRTGASAVNVLVRDRLAMLRALAGGQRIAPARPLVNDAALLVLAEPTPAMDFRTETHEDPEPRLRMASQGLRAER